MNLKTTTLLTLLFLTFGLQAQDTPEKIINDFFKNYETKGPGKAIDELYATNPWTTRIQDAVNNVRTQFERFDEELVGKYHGFEKLTTKQIGDSYALYAYFIKFDRQFLRLTFQFYKPNDQWRLSSFKFDDSFDDELEEAAKMYYLPLD